MHDDAGNFIHINRRTKKQALLEQRAKHGSDGIDRSRMRRAPAPMQAAFGQRQSHLVSLLAAEKKER